jgi:hypothetical protein
MCPKMDTSGLLHGRYRAVVYARNDCQHPTAAKRSEQPQDCVPGLSVWLDNLFLQDTKRQWS